MTAISSLTPQRARDLGRALAHRLVPLSRDPAQLSETASLALLSLLPTWLPPGEEATAIALRQLVREACFSACLLAPPPDEAAAAAADPAFEALRAHLGRTFAEGLQPPLLLFSEACREALRDRLAQVPPLPAVAPVSARAGAPAAAPSAGIGLLLSSGLAALACVALGWLGYQLVAGLRPSAFSNVPPEPPPSPPSPIGAAAGAAGSALQPPPDRSRRDGQTTTSDRGAPLAALQCLGGPRGETLAPADPSNYGPRQVRDWQGRPVPHTPQLIVLHETVVDEAAALNLFRRRNGQDAQQASYHVLIGRDGGRIRVVDDGQRAFGAGDSALGGLSVQLREGLRPSVNNIALHVSLVSPGDGADGEALRHGGYTPEQYRSLAAQIALWQARWGISADRVVTHQEVDRSGSRRDPRSFDWQALGRELHQRWRACGGTARIAELGR